MQIFGLCLAIYMKGFFMGGCWWTEVVSLWWYHAVKNVQHCSVRHFTQYVILSVGEPSRKPINEKFMSWTVPTPSPRLIASAHLTNASHPTSHLWTCWVLARAPEETRRCQRAKWCQNDTSEQAPFSLATVTANSATGNIMKQLSRCSHEPSWPTPWNSLHDRRGNLPVCNS